MGMEAESVFDGEDLKPSRSLERGEGRVVTDGEALVASELGGDDDATPLLEQLAGMVVVLKQSLGEHRRRGYAADLHQPLSE